MSGGTLSWLWRALKGKKRNIAALLMVQVVLSICSIGYSLLFRGLIDRAVEHNRPGFWLFLGLLAGMALLQLALRAFNRWLDEKTRSSVENRFKLRLFETLLYREYASVTGVHTGEWMNRLTSDTLVVANGLAQIIPNLGGMLVRMVGALWVIMVLEPMFGTLLVPAGLVLIFVTRGFRPLLKRLHGKIQESDGQVRVFLQERLDNLLIISTFSQQNRALELADERMDQHKKARMKRNHVSNISQVGFGTAIQGLYLAGAGFCCVGIMNGTVTYGTMTAVLQLIGHLQAPFSGISNYLTQWYGMIASAERLMEAEGYPLDTDGQILSGEEIQKYYRDEFAGFRLENVQFSYVDRTDGKERSVRVQYDDITFRKGEFVALAGRSGCGKSTLLKLLMCLYKPDCGNMWVLDNSGKTHHLSVWERNLFAYVPQGNQLMSGKIREVIAFYDAEKMHQDEEIWRALKIACADEFVARLPNGLDTLLGEHGSGLSEGQLQRIALARAIFSRRPVLLLDESTSALDEATERQLLTNLRTMTDHTVLIVTHRPQVCGSCDRILDLAAEASDPSKEE